MSAADDFLRYHQPGHGGLFTELLTEAIRAYSDRGFHSHGATFSEFFQLLVLVRLQASRRSRTFQDADDEYSVEEDVGIEEDHPAPAHAPPGAASEAAIAALEVVEAPDDDCCPVCLQEGAGGAWRRVAPCGHRFHAACVAPWLRVKLSCPVCRRPAASAAVAEPRRGPLPAIVEEAMAMRYEEYVVFTESARWMEFLATFRDQSTGNSTDVSAGAA